MSQSTALTVRLSQLPAAERTALLDRAIERYGAGESVYQIAAEIGVEHTTLYRHLVKEKESEWREAKVSKALVEIEAAEEELKTAPDALALTRARERFRAASWHLERLYRRMFGQDQVADAGTRIAITLNIAAPQKDEKVVSDQ